MIGRFWSAFQGSVFERLATLRHEGTVEECVLEFEMLVGQTHGVSEEQVLGYFLVGLCEDIKGRFEFLIRRLMVAMRIARDVEDATIRASGGSWSATQNSQSWTQAIGPVTRNENSHPNPSQLSGVDNEATVRKEGSRGSGGPNSIGG